MAEILDAPAVLLEDAGGVPVGSDVECDLTIQPLHGTLRSFAVEYGGLRFAYLLEPAASIRQVVGPFVVSELIDEELRTDLVVGVLLIDLEVVAAPLEQQRLDGHDAVASAHGRRRIADQLLARILCDRGRLQKHKT